MKRYAEDIIDLHYRKYCQTTRSRLMPQLQMLLERILHLSPAQIFLATSELNKISGTLLSFYNMPQLSHLERVHWTATLSQELALLFKKSIDQFDPLDQFIKLPVYHNYPHLVAMGSNLESLIKFPIKGRIVQSTKTSLKLAFLSTGHVANYHRIRVRPWLALFFCTPAGINSTDHGHHTNIFKTRSKSPMRLYQ